MESLEKSWRNKHDKREHDWLYVVVLLSTILLYTITVGFNVIPSGSSMIPNDVGSLSYSTFYIDVIPAGWVFATIWSLIFFFQFVWLIYNFICIFRTTSDGQLLYRTVNFLPMGTLIAFMVNNVMVITWIFLFSNKLAGWALIPIVGCTLALHVSIFFSFWNLYRCKHELANLKCKADIWLVRFLVQNSLGLFLTWVSIASNLNFAFLLGYNAGVNIYTSASIALAVILLVIIVYFILENFIWQRYLLYMFSPWFVVHIALIGCLVRNWNASSPSVNNIFALIMLIIVFCMLVVKIVMFVLYHTALKNRVDSVICRKNRVSDMDAAETGLVKEGFLREEKRASDEVKPNPAKKSVTPTKTS